MDAAPHPPTQESCQDYLRTQERLKIEKRQQTGGEGFGAEKNSEPVLKKYT